MENKQKVIYPELSYKIIGALFDVYNELGAGYQEKYYQKAIEVAFGEKGIEFKSQFPIVIKFKDRKIGHYLLDFLIEGRIILEIKKGDYFSKNNIEQVLGYLKSTNSKLAILANFTPTGVKFRRVLNIY